MSQPVSHASNTTTSGSLLPAHLQKVVDARGTQYAAVSAFLLSWEKDNTDAASDIRSMSALLQDEFGITSKLCMVPESDRTPGWTLRAALANATGKLTPTSGDKKSLFIFYYVGHGYVDRSRGLLFASGAANSKEIPWDTVRNSVFLNDSSIDHIDALGILDCCYAGSARAGSTRSMQVLAACGPNQQARSRTGGASFTVRLGVAVRSLRSQGIPIVTPAAIFSEIERQKPSGLVPSCHLSVLGGSHPIALAFVKKRTSTASRIPVATRVTDRDKNVLVSLTLSGQHKEATKEFQRIIQNLPGHLGVTLVDAYETDASALVLARMSLEVWARLSHHLDLDYIGVIIGPSLVHRTESDLRHTKVENIPPTSSSRKPYR
ncbi:hypothetical protein N7468_005489 [Penicillium chermesinum]|uniref:Peptidase C14 caspase domain-containing protein n=1 Tax=Penicillium chermesinum TaxID=63820 RepID=A0A9W9NZB5_9EURO|nr:uncharacterized protein N7468_005489 [Penicillium chermesinum]KAJ5232533.1 hypothetical protein N7468_005489 [Penicillium chermesinum]